jgi:hypothetical protein
MFISLSPPPTIRRRPFLSGFSDWSSCKFVLRYSGTDEEKIDDPVFSPQQLQSLCDESTNQPQAKSLFPSALDSHVQVRRLRFVFILGETSKARPLDLFEVILAFVALSSRTKGY